MVMILEQQMVTQIARIGRDRAPNEACGILLPMPVNGQQIIELPNRSKTPHDSFEMHGNDMLLALEMLWRGDFPENLIKSLTLWHTHPNGGVGPSRFDLQNKPAYCNSLVVTLFDDGHAPLASWF